MTAIARLEKARAERGKVEAALADLRTQRDGLDVQSDDYAVTYEKLDSRVALQERQLVIVSEQIERLKVKVEAEARDAAKARRATAIAVVEKMLPERAAIVKESENTVRSLPAMFEKLATWRARFIAHYPEDVERPYEFFLSDDRVLRHVTAALHAIRIEDASESIEGLAADEAGHHAALIEDLRRGSAPEIESLEAA